MLVLALLAGCVTVTPPAGSPQPTQAPAAEADTPFEVELRDVSVDGERSLESALRLFSMTYGPLPGVEDVPDSNDRVEGTLAMRAILAKYDELTPEQQAVVDEWLADDPDDVVVQVGPEGDNGALAAVDGFAGFVAQPLTGTQQAIKGAVGNYRAQIASRIGQIPGIIDVSFPSKKRPDLALADAGGIYVNGAFTGCRIRFFPNLLTDSQINMLITAAHETFHCFQAAQFTDSTRYANGPDWWQEGGAEWVAYVLAGDPLDGGFWDDYVNKPQLSLFQRSYDGVGFWADLAATGIDPWPRWMAIWAAYENEGAWVASGGEADDFLDSWSSGWFRDRGRGDDWDMSGPGIIPGNATPKSIQVANGASASLGASPYANEQYSASSSADIVIITGTGHMRVSDSSLDEKLPIGQHFCTKPGGCTCPDGKPLPYPVTQLGQSFYVAVTGGNSGAGGNVSGISLEDACKEEEETDAFIVRVDRPAAEGVLPGTVVDLLTCDGPYGTWSGQFWTGGLSNQGFEVPWTSLPVEFTFPGEEGSQTATTTTSAVVSTPIGPLPLDYAVTVTSTGGQMTIVLVPGSEGMGNNLVDIPVQPAPEGSCPE